MAACKSYVDFQLYGGSVLLTPELTVQGSNVLISGKIRLYNKDCTLYIYIIQQYTTERNNKIKQISEISRLKALSRSLLFGYCFYK